jgi:hypothetical protein
MPANDTGTGDQADALLGRREASAMDDQGRPDESGPPNEDHGREAWTDNADGTEDATEQMATRAAAGTPWTVVGRGEVGRLVAAYRVAVRQAGELAAALDRAGLGGEVLAVTAGLDDRGEPLVSGTLTLAGARRLADLLAAGPPPPGLPVADRPPPWAA